MDWYHCNGMEDLVVPTHQEVDDNLPSPGSWSKWDFNSPGNFNDECFAVAENLTCVKSKSNGRLCHGSEFESTADVNDPSTCWSIYGGLSSNQGRVSQHQTYHQLDDFGRFEQLDDIFLASLLEDPTWGEDLHKSFCFSPGFKCETMAADYLLPDASPAKILVPPEQITANGFVSEGMSLEESVLKELEMVTTQLSDKTRICFRDAFYRLAKNSKQNPVALDQQGSLHAQTHPLKWTISEEKIRSGKNEKTESETNTIDRTIASLTFDKMDINIRDFPVCQPQQF
ncbi:protein LNK3-like isoform X1 [Hibiscus syriacus]|nr:protein LNK3-like isoform X1 [Hibiscus syriacus]